MSKTKPMESKLNPGLTKFTDVTQHANHIYYNITLANKNDPSNPNQVSRFSETRPSPFIQYPKDFYLSTVRYNVSGQAIPWFYFNNINGGTPTGSSQPSYSITLEYKGNLYKTYVPYISNTTFVPDIPSASIQDPNTIDNLAVYSVELWVKMINSCFTTGYTTLQAANPGLPVADPPFLTFNGSTQLFTLYADTAVFNEALANPVNIYFSLSLFNKFSTFSHIAQNTTGLYFGTNGKDMKIRCFDTKINTEAIGGITYLKIQQEAKTISDCFDIQSLIITTNNIPSRDEYAQGASDIFPILSDFSVAGLLTTTSDRNNITYLPSAQYRYIDLISENPMKVLDVNFLWLDKYGKLRDVYIISGAQISVKMLFEHKDLKLLTNAKTK